VESVREFDPRTQRSIAPVNWTTILPLTEWAVVQGDGADAWAVPTYWGPANIAATRSLFELTPSSLEPVIFLDEPGNLRPVVDTLLAEATEAYEKLGMANAPEAATFYWQAEEFDLALQLATRVELEQLGMSLTEAARFNLSSRPSTRFHGDVVACVGDVKSQLANGGKIFLTAASTGELERYADICREYEVPYVLGESENAASGFTAEGALESAGLALVRAPFGEGTTFPDARLTIFGNADLFDVAPSVERPTRKIRTSGFFSDFADLKAGDFVVHVDHGIGQFEGLRQIESTGGAANSCCPLCRGFAIIRAARTHGSGAKLPSGRVRRRRSINLAEPAGRRAAKVRKSLEDMAESC
jgi:transcription-repair coupling factor (superfamily II helicase)